VVSVVADESVDIVCEGKCPPSSNGCPCVLRRRPVALRERELNERTICAISLDDIEREADIARLGELPPEAMEDIVWLEEA